MTKEEMQVLSEMLDKKFDEKLTPINDRLVKLEQGQTKMEVTIENQVDRAIKTIAEGHSIINRKLDEKINLENRVEDVENRLSAVEYSLKKTE